MAAKIWDELVKEVGRSYEVTGFIGDSDLVQRLQELGFFKNQSVQYYGQSPFNGPFLFRLSSTTIALREEEAKCLMLERI